MKKTKDTTVIGVDLGGTKILAGKVQNEQIVASCKTAVPKGGSETEVLQALYQSIDQIVDASVMGIGIGVPSVVDTEKGIVYDVQNIPSWQEVRLKDLMEERYGLPVYVNNDANCFAAGEKHFGKGQNHKNFAALIVGTGIAAGLIINDRLYNGHNCGAGEFGMIPYLEHHYEYYCSGQFFTNCHGIDGQIAAQRAMKGDAEALALFKTFGHHLGNAIKAILYAIDPGVIIMGGSVSKAYPLFEKSMWESIRQFAYRNVLEDLTIEISTNPDIAVLGAAALYFDAAPAQVKY